MSASHPEMTIAFPSPMDNQCGFYFGYLACNPRCTLPRDEQIPGIIGRRRNGRVIDKDNLPLRMS